MCLGVPAKVVSIQDRMIAQVDSFGVYKKINIALVPDIDVGDYVLVHAGHALEKIDMEEARERMKLWDELLAKEEEL